jgi:spermidine/putrescine transport system permease protein
MAGAGPAGVAPEAADVAPEPPAPRGRRGRRVTPYLLGAPAALWLGVFFIVPLVTMLSLSLQTCNQLTLACSLTWHWSEYPNVVGDYTAQFTRSITYAGAAAIIDIVVSFPLVYWIAFRAKRKSVFLLLLLVPFFVSYVIRTILWQFILSDNGVLLGTLKSLHLLPESFRVLDTGAAVVAGLAYSYLPFAALPLFVGLERIDYSVVEAAHDLYGNKRATFSRVVWPLALPGVFAAFLLTFVPAAGDYVNATLLGGTGSTMIGNVIQNKFLVFSDYPGASALSAVLMAFMLLGVFIYSRALGSRTIEEYV